MAKRRLIPINPTRQRKTPGVVKAQILTCQRCELESNCKFPIPYMSGSGPKTQGNPPRNDYIVLGEAPGRVENSRGKPFIGPSGKFLRAALTHAGLDPEDGVYMNAVCCYPNGTPTYAHVVACHDNLADQLALFDTKWVLVCGATALKALLPNATLAYIMGVAIPVHGKIIYPVWHPSYLLRSKQSLPIWRNHLARFALLSAPSPMMTPEDTWPGHCLYCTAGRMPGELACHKHVNKWAEDQAWVPSTPYKQDRLLDG